MLEKDEEDEDWVATGMPNFCQKMTSVKAFPFMTFDGSLVNERHRNVSLPTVTGFGTLGGPNTPGEADTSKKAGKIPLGDRPNSLKSGISTGATPGGLHIGQLKMDMPLVFTTSRQ